MELFAHFVCRIIGLRLQSIIVTLSMLLRSRFPLGVMCKFMVSRCCRRYQSIVGVHVVTHSSVCVRVRVCVCVCVCE